MFELGRLEKVDLREIWQSEPADFTPWLAQPENLSILSETLGIDLEFEAQERSVGPFRADILCKDIGTDNWVLVENQLAKTDHTHLGQLLTYASGLQAVTIVWIAAQFTEEHRATLDWLNEITDDKFRFFGLEVELWRIGQSLAAPKFNAVSKPNNWSRSVARAARSLDDAELTETRVGQREYWDAFHAQLQKSGGPVSGNRKAQPQSWMNYGVGRTGFHLSANMNRLKKYVRTELYISGQEAKKYFELLLARREVIENKLGFPLEWEPLPDRTDCRVAVYLRDANADQNEDWNRQHEWLCERINQLHTVFSTEVKALSISNSGEALDN
ncbi:DUF4268 domain-containing protein [Ruegeria arenilitoris]|uniref:DUF4268 domain-containing protein n=1 Tax=Ruegeria arenilitoris TaxID=1173585 RepID=UPI00147F3D30|nr:DUF4268 domain-containing protein [Ruegeria arenilitoris]